MSSTNTRWIGRGLSLALVAVLAACTPGVQSGDISAKFGGVKNGRAISPTAIVLDWIKSPEFSAYEVYVSYQRAPLAESIFSTVTLENLAPNTTYLFKVVGKGSTTGAGGDAEYEVTTWPRFKGLDRAYKDSDGNIVVEWEYPYAVEEYHIFYKAEEPPTAANTNNWATPNAVTSSNRHTFRGLNGATTYYFTVHAKYRGTEFERPDKVLTGTTVPTFPDYIDRYNPEVILPKITIGSLPTLNINPTVTAEFPASNYVSQVFINGVAVSDPVRGAGKATLAPTTPFPLGKLDNITLKVRYSDARIDETLTIPNLWTYLKGVVPFVDSPPIQEGLGPAYMGRSVATGDFNCDGYDDLAVGLPYVSLAQYGITQSNAGAIYVFYGGLSSGGRFTLKTSPAPVRDPAQPGKDPQVITFPDLTWDANFGWSMAGRGNLNGDKQGPYSCDDLIVGAPGQTSPDGYRTGNVFVFYGAANVGLKAPATLSAFPQNAETCDGKSAGAICTAVRLWPDYSLWPASALGGQAYSATKTSSGLGGRIRYGESVSYIGDFNADGNEDLAIGAPDAPWDGIPVTYMNNSGWNPERVGYVALYFGNPFGLGYESPTPTASQKFRWLKVFPPIPQQNMRFGASIAGGDVDGRHRVKRDDGVLVGGGDFVVGAPGFYYNRPIASTLVANQWPMTGSDPDSSATVEPLDGGWWGTLPAGNWGVHPRYGFTQYNNMSVSGTRQGVAFVFFGRSLDSAATVPDSNNPAKPGFWACGKRGIVQHYEHYSCLASGESYRVLFPRDAKSYGFGSAVAIVGDKSARDQADDLRCQPPTPYAAGISKTPVAQGVCRDANGDSFGDIVVLAADADMEAADGRTKTGALWQFFGNFDRAYELGAGLPYSGSTLDAFGPRITTGSPANRYFQVEAQCQAMGNSVFHTDPDWKAAEYSDCRPTRLVPNSVPSSARMGWTNAAISVGDLTRDGLNDVVVGAPYDNTRGTNGGAAYAFTSFRGFGLTSNIKKVVRNDNDTDDRLGWSVAVGDFDGTDKLQYHLAYTCSTDGSDTCDPNNKAFNLLPYNDLVASAPYADKGPSPQGRPGGGSVHIFQTGSSVLPAIRTTSDTDIYEPLASIQDFRYSSTRIVGDINGDGYEDAVGHIQSYTDSGATAYDGIVYFGSPIGLVTTSFCLKNLDRVFKSGAGSAAECYPSRSHPTSITNHEIVLPQKLVRPNNVSSSWAEIGAAAGDVNADGFADVVFIDGCTSTDDSGNCSGSQILVYYGTRGGLQDIVIPSWRPANNDPQIISKRVTVPTHSISAASMYRNVWSQIQNPVQFGDFNGDGYSDVVISDPEAYGPSLSDPTTALEPYGGSTFTIPDMEWPFGSETTSGGTKWRCLEQSPPVPECADGRRVWNHGAVFIYYGSQHGVATPAMYETGLTGAVDLNTPGVRLNFVYGTEDNDGNPAGPAALSNAGTFCTTLGTDQGICIPPVQILRNPVMINVRNGYTWLDHFFGASTVPIRIYKTDAYDSLLISAPGYEHPHCLNFDDPTAAPPTGAPQLNQGRIYVFRGSVHGIIAANRNQYYPLPPTAAANSADCANLSSNAGQANDTGLGLGAYPDNRLRAMRMTFANTSADETAIGIGVSGQNTRNRQYSLRMVNGGDFNGDGYEDLVVTAPQENVYDQNLSMVRQAGAGYVFYGPLCPTDNDWSLLTTAVQDKTNLNKQLRFPDLTGTVTLAATCAGKQLAPQKFRVKDIAPAVSGDNGSTDHKYGYSVAGARMRGDKQGGDVNLDEYSDLIIGSPYWNDTINGANQAGRGILLFGSPQGLFTDDYPSPVVESLSAGRVKPYVLTAPVPVTNPQANANAMFFEGNLSTGDVNGDKSMDLMVPSVWYDEADGFKGIDLGTFFMFY